jgi:hypothetical protein
MAFLIYKEQQNGLWEQVSTIKLGNVFREHKHVEKLRYYASQSGEARAGRISGTTAVQQLSSVLVRRRGVG